ncbi:MAG: hypothetical protein J6J57_00895 [Alistipes sp.]|nr:hypothetical protein [Alistipes sp.]
MKRLLFVLFAAVALCACEAPGNGGEQKPPRPENALSTLTDDKEVVFDVAQVWADCFGDYYNTGYYMWGMYLQAYDTREQVYVELLTSSTELVVPTGKFTVTAAAKEQWSDRCILPGIMAEEYGEVYQAYSWFLKVDPSSGFIPVYLEQAPIVKGVLTITEESEGYYDFTFEFEDDAYNRIYGTYKGGAAVEDFRM